MRTIEAAISASAVSGILIGGAEGVGKSRIAREALSAVASQGSETRWTVGTSPGRAIPLGAFTAWAPSGVTDTVQLLRGVIESLTAASSGTKVVVGVDDVHLLDDLSTFVVHQIVQQGAAKVILTVRDDEPIPAAIQAIWTAGQFDRLDLEQLSLGQTTALLSAALEGSVDADAAQRLWKLTRGNVLYLRNIVEQEVADGRIVQQGGYWRWIGDPVVPRGLVGLVESRIGAVATPVSDVIDVLAVGEPIELGIEQVAPDGFYRHRRSETFCGAQGNRRPLPRAPLTAPSAPRLGRAGQHYRHRASFAAAHDVGPLPAWAGSTREFTTATK